MSTQIITREEAKEIVRSLIEAERFTENWFNTVEENGTYTTEPFELPNGIMCYISIITSSHKYSYVSLVQLPENVTHLCMLDSGESYKECCTLIFG